MPEIDLNVLFGMDLSYQQIVDLFVAGHIGSSHMFDARRGATDKYTRILTIFSERLFQKVLEMADNWEKMEILLTAGPEMADDFVEQICAKALGMTGSKEQMQIVEAAAEGTHTTLGIALLELAKKWSGRTKKRRPRRKRSAPKDGRKKSKNGRRKGKRRAKRGQKGQESETAHEPS
jgi:hypothetical protein